MKIVRKPTGSAEGGGRKSPVNSNIRTLLDELVKKHHDKGIKTLKVTVTGLHTRLMEEGYTYGERTIRDNGFPGWWSFHYESCNWIKYRGLFINTEQYLEERKEEKKEDKERYKKQLEEEAINIEEALHG